MTATGLGREAAISSRHPAIDADNVVARRETAVSTKGAGEMGDVR